MKVKNLTLCALALIGLIACSDDSFEGGQSRNTGYLSFEMEASGDVEHLTRADIKIATAAGEGYTDPAEGDFSITITNDDDYSWSGKVSEWDPTTALEAGDYSVKATYDNGNKVGFNAPVFEGSQNFTIIGGQTITVEVHVTLQNAIVRLQYTDMFKNYYSFEKFTVTSIGTAIDFVPTESRGAFIEATKFTIEGTLTSQAQGEDGTPVSKTFSKEYTAEKKQCYTIRFDASNVGGNSITIQFGDEPADAIDFGDIDINDGEEEGEGEEEGTDQNS